MTGTEIYRLGWWDGFVFGAVLVTCCAVVGMVAGSLFWQLIHR